MQALFNHLVCSFIHLYSYLSQKFLLSATGNIPHRPLRRGQSLLGREEDVHESGLALFKRGTVRRKRQPPTEADEALEDRRRCLGNIPGPHDGWVTYCYLLTACAPPFLLRSCGESAVSVFGNPTFVYSSVQVSVALSNSAPGEKKWA